MTSSPGPAAVALAKKLRGLLDYDWADAAMIQQAFDEIHDQYREDFRALKINPKTEGDPNEQTSCIDAFNRIPK